MKALLKKLLIIQKAIDCIAKSETGFNYSYAGQEQVLNTIRPLMNDNGLLLMQEVLEVENTRIDYKLSNGKEKSEILTSAKQLFTWMDCDSGETLECRFHANGMNDWEKGLGSALTYAERYFLLKFFHIPTPADDPDSRQTPPQQTPPAPPKVESKPQSIGEDEIPLNITMSESMEELTEIWGKLDTDEKKKHGKQFTERKLEISLKKK